MRPGPDALRGVAPSTTAPPARESAGAPLRLDLCSSAPVLRSSAQLWAAVHLPGFDSAAQLEQLATRAQRFTPRVSLVPPDGLLLEVKGSLELFAGVTGLRRELSDECR